MMTKHKDNTINSYLGYIYSWICTLLVIGVCLFIIINIAYYGYHSLSLDFLITEPNPSAIDTEAGGILTPLCGTVILTVIGIIIAFPFSLATAIYLRFYSKKGLFNDSIRFAIDILSGVPTVVIGLFALSIFTKPAFIFLSSVVDSEELVQRAYGKSFLVAGVAMAVMILPFVIKSMEEAIKSVPASYVEGSYALGATKWRTIYKVVLKSASQGIVTGVILGMGRIIGDTAIVWLALGGTLRMTGDQPWYSPENWISTLRNTGSTLTTYIYYTSPAGEGNNYEVAFGASLVLIVIIIMLNLVASLLGYFAQGKGEHR